MGLRIFWWRYKNRFKTYVSYASITLGKVIGRRGEGRRGLCCVLCQLALQPVIAQSSLCLFLAQLANRLAG